MRLDKQKTSLILAFSAVAAQVAAMQALPENVKIVAQLVVTFIAALVVPKQ